MMEKPVYKFTLYDSLPNLNQTLAKALANRYTYGKTKKKIDANIAWEIKVQLPGVRITSRMSVVIHWYVKDRRKDPDNVYSAVKYILDGAQKSGIISGDGFKNVADILNQVEVDKQRPRAEIYLLPGRRLNIDPSTFKK